MQRILQELVRSGERVNDAEIAGFAPAIPEPAAYGGLVVFFFGHDVASFRLSFSRAVRNASA
jgi:hypothetical protein